MNARWGAQGYSEQVLASMMKENWSRDLDNESWSGRGIRVGYSGGCTRIESRMRTGVEDGVLRMEAGAGVGVRSRAEAANGRCRRLRGCGERHDTLNRCAHMTKAGLDLRG